MNETRNDEPMLEAGEATPAEIDEVAGMLRSTRAMPGDGAFERQADDIMSSLRPHGGREAAARDDHSADSGESWFEGWLRRMREAWNDMTRVEIGGWAVAATVLVIGVGFAITQLGEAPGDSSSPATNAPGGVEVADDGARGPDAAPDPDDRALQPLDGSAVAAEAALEEDAAEFGSDDGLDSLDRDELAALDDYAVDQLEPRADARVVDVLAADDTTTLDELDDEELAVLVAALDDDPFFDTEYQR